MGIGNVVEAERDAATEAEQLLQQYTALSKQLGEAKRSGAALTALKAEHKRVFDRLQVVSPRKPGKLNKAQELRLHVDLLTEPDQLRDLRQPWDDMLERIGNYSPFVTWEWWWPWLQSFSALRQPYVLVAKDQQGLLHGALPLSQDARRPRQAYFVGSGCGPDPAYVSPPMANAQALGLLLGALRDSPINSVSWQQCPVDDRLSEILTALAKEDWQMSLRIRRHYVHGELPSTWDAYVDGVPNKNRRNLLRHQFEQLEQAWGTPVCGVHTAASDEAYAVIAQMARFNVHRRALLGDRSRWQDITFQRCLDHVTELFAGRGWLRLVTIHVGDELAAALLGWAYRGTFFAYQIGTHPQHADLGLGHCIISHAIRSSIEEGLQRFEMLGQASQFKRTYFPGLTPAATVVLGPDRSDYWLGVGWDALRRAAIARLREVKHGA